jgi:hypothetical protein
MVVVLDCQTDGRSSGAKPVVRFRYKRKARPWLSREIAASSKKNGAAPRPSSPSGVYSISKAAAAGTHAPADQRLLTL